MKKHVCLFPGGERRSEHRQLSFLPAALHGAVAERSDFRCDHGGHEEVNRLALHTSAAGLCWHNRTNELHSYRINGGTAESKDMKPLCLLSQECSCDLTRFMSHFPPFVCFHRLLGSQTSWRTWLLVLSLPSCCTAARWKRTPTRSRSS